MVIPLYISSQPLLLERVLEVGVEIADALDAVHAKGIRGIALAVPIANRSLLVSISILVADDFVLWRGFVSSTVQREADWHIVGEASDGPEAVQKTKDLAPDLILLDIGLPALNGIEVARQIRKFLPHSKILFLSGLHDPDIVREAMRTGASGYVVKLDAGSELTKAIEAILRGQQYLSSRNKRVRFKGQRGLAESQWSSPQREPQPSAKNSDDSVPRGSVLFQ